MAKNAQHGEKTNKQGKRGKNEKRNESNSNSDSSSVVSFDSVLMYSSDFDEASNFQMLQKHFDQKLILMQTELQDEINALHQVIKENM